MKRILFLIAALFCGFGLHAQITVNTNFQVNSANPIDQRYVINSLGDTTGLTFIYEGLHTYVKDENKDYFWDGVKWREVTASVDVSDLVARDSTIQIYLIGAQNSDTIVSYFINQFHANQPRIRRYEVICFNNSADSILTVRIPDLTDSSYVFNQVEINVMYVKNNGAGLDGLELIIEHDSSFWGPEGYVSTDTLTAGQFCTFKGVVDGGGPDRLIWQEKPFGSFSGGGGTTTIPGYGATSRGDTLDVDTTVIASKSYVDSEVEKASTIKLLTNQRFLTAILPNGKTGKQVFEIDPTDPDLFYDLQYTGPLDIPTYDANNQVTHPDVMFFPDSLYGYRYWMIFTPYPSEPRENPSVVASNDGTTWVEPPGISNPIQPYPGSGWNSDVTWTTIDDTTLVALYNQQLSNQIDKFLYRTSNDGVTWSDSILLFQESTNIGELLSPSVAQYNGKYHLWYGWYLNAEPDSKTKIKMVHRESNTFPGLSTAVADTCKFDFPASVGNRWIWHYQINFSEKRDEFVGVASFTAVGTPNQQGRFHYMTSTDAINWRFSEKEVFSLSEKMLNDKYVTSIVPTGAADTVGATFDAFTSQLGTGNWRIFRGKVFMKDWNPPTLSGNWDAYKNEIASVYSFKQRFSDWHGLPVCELYTENRDSTGFLYHPDSLLIDVVDSLKYTTWANGDEVFISKMYDQASPGGNYLQFNDSIPLLDTISSYSQVNGLAYHLSRPGSPSGQHGRAITTNGLSTVVFVAPRIGQNGNKWFSAGAYYMDDDRILTSGNNFFFDQPLTNVNVWSAVMKSTGQVRANGNLLRQATLNTPPAGDFYVGAYDATPLQDFKRAVMSDVVTLKSTHSTQALEAIESTLINDYNLGQPVDTLLFYNFNNGISGDTLDNYLPEINNTGLSNDSLYYGLNKWWASAYDDGTWILTDSTLTSKVGGFYQLTLWPDTSRNNVCISYDIKTDGASGRTESRLYQSSDYWNFYWPSGSNQQFTFTGTSNGENGKLSVGSRTNPYNVKVCWTNRDEMFFYTNGVLKYRGNPVENGGGRRRITLRTWNDESPEIDNLLITASSNW